MPNRAVKTYKNNPQLYMAMVFSRGKLFKLK